LVRDKKSELSLEYLIRKLSPHRETIYKLRKNQQTNRQTERHTQYTWTDTGTKTMKDTETDAGTHISSYTRT